MADFYIKRGDRLPKISSTLKDAAGAAVNLTGAAVKFQMKKIGASARKVDTAATVVGQAEDGKVEYAWGATDTDETGMFEAEWEVAIGGLIQSFPNDKHLLVQISDSI